MCLRLNPGPVPPHDVREALLRKSKFLKKFVDTLPDAGTVVAAFGAPFASPAMTVVKPSSIKAIEVSDNIDIDPGIGADGPRSSQKKTIKYRMVIDYSAMIASTVPDPFPVPKLQSLELLLANQSFMSLGTF